MNYATYENLKDRKGAGAGGSLQWAREAFRDHIRICGRCRLTEYSGRIGTQWHERYPSDTGFLCKEGLRLWVAPEKLREAVNPKNQDVSTEILMRWMGHERC